MVDIPRVEINYSPNNKHFHLEFVTMRSKTLSQSYKPGSRSECGSKAMRCREFSFLDINEKPQSVHGFRKGKIVENRQRQLTSDSLYEDINQRQNTEDFAIAGQKLNLNTADPAIPNVIPPREWVIEKSRTLPDIHVHDCIAPYPTPVKLFRAMKPKVRERLNVSMESLASMDKPGKETEPKQMNKEEPDSKPQEDTLPKISDASDGPPTPTLKGVTVSLQTDDYLYYNTPDGDSSARPTTSQNSRPVRYQPMRIISPSKKLPNVFEKKSFTSREPSKRKVFPSLRLAHKAVLDSSTRFATKQASIKKLSSSLPLLANPNMTL